MNVMMNIMMIWKCLMIRVTQGDVIIQDLSYNEDIQYEVFYVINDPIHKTGKILALINSPFMSHSDGPQYYWQTTKSINKDLRSNQTKILFHWEI